MIVVELLTFEVSTGEHDCIDDDADVVVSSSRAFFGFGSDES